VFLDESGFLRLPTRRRTWGPSGQTPRVHYNYRHDRMSALAALRVSAVRKRMGRYLRFQSWNFCAEHVARFPHLLLRRLRGPVILLWDKGRIHKGPLITQLQTDYPRLHIEAFPGYAPELNPTEQVWNDFQGHNANRLFRDQPQRRLRLHGKVRRVRRSPAELRSFILASDLPSPPWSYFHYLRETL
jgi:transposase